MPTLQKPCGTCNGTGLLNGQTCIICNGAGLVNAEGFADTAAYGIMYVLEKVNDIQDKVNDIKEKVDEIKTEVHAIAVKVGA